MKKYGLQLRVQPSQQQKKPLRPSLPAALGFRDDDEDDVEKEISRQASKNKSLKDVEEQHKKALEEDPSVFDYDGVYDEMKEKIARPRAQDREERKPKYIQALMKKAEVRQREQEIVYERKIAKERSKDDHLYADKDKFVTSAYKKKLAEQAKWMEEERLRELREEKDDVTKKTDLSDFYFNLGKNVAFGAKDLESRKLEKQTELAKTDKAEDEVSADVSDTSNLLAGSRSAVESSQAEEGHRSKTSHPPTISESSSHRAETTEQGNTAVEQRSADEPTLDHHKRNDEAVSAARERFLARKRAKMQ